MKWNPTQMGGRIYEKTNDFIMSGFINGIDVCHDAAMKAMEVRTIHREQHSSPELTLPETRRIRKIPFREQRRKIRHRPGEETQGTGSNILVAYFSWAENAILEEDVDAVASPSVIAPGNVQELAGWVQEETGGDLFSIQVTDPYPSDWDACLERANEERGEDARPELTSSVENLDAYDTVFLGYPKIQYGFLSV